MLRQSIIVKNNFKALHCWPAAPKEVSFLAYPHRHVFYVETEIEVTHGNRELEFFIVQQYLQEELEAYSSSSDIGSVSCERIAGYIVKLLIDKYGKRRISCTVYEDNENGGKLVYEPE